MHPPLASIDKANRLTFSHI